MKSRGYGQNIVQSGGAGVAAIASAQPQAVGSILQRLLADGNPEQERVMQANQINEKGENELHRLAYLGKEIEMSRLLSLPGIDINAKENVYGDTPLHKAIDSGKTQIALQLLTAGARADIANKKGELPLHYAAFNGREEVAIELVKAMAAAKVSLDAKETTYGDTALHKAATSSNPNADKIVKLLVSNHANPNEANTKGETPAHYAAYTLNWQVIRALYVGGGGEISRFDPKKQDLHGVLPIHKVTRKSEAVDTSDNIPKVKKIYNTAKALIDAKADVNDIASNKESALIHAAYNKDLHAILALRFLNADVNDARSGCQAKSKPVGVGAEIIQDILGKSQEAVMKSAQGYGINLSGDYDDLDASAAAAYG